MSEETIDEVENPRKQIALELAQRGFYILAVAPGSKEPDKLLAPNGFYDATRDPAVIGGWFDVKPKCNIGIACGAAYGTVVLDVDVKNSGHGLDTLTKLEFDALTLTTNSPSGGLHLFFKHPGEKLVAKLDGLDIKGADGGGYVVGPGSVLSEAFALAHTCVAGPYTWCDEEIPIADMPPRLVEQLRAANGKAPPGATKAALSAAAGPVASTKVGHGDRHYKLKDLGAVFRGKGLLPEDIEALLWHHATANFDPPFSRDKPEDVNEIEGVVRWYGSKEANNEPLTILTTAQLRQLAKASPVRQLLDPVLPEAGSLMIYGATGVGKSHIGLCIAGAMALGRSFMDWTVTQPQPVLFIDGEMSLGELGVRLAAYFGDAALERLSWIAARARKDDLPNLADPAAQEIYFAAVCASGARVVVFDNLSALRSTSTELPENSIEAWQPVGAFIRRLNRAGVAVVLVHHANRAGGQRGSTGHVAPMDTVLCLREIPENQADPLAENDIEFVFEKHRQFGGTAAQTFRAKAIGDPDGRVVWQRVGPDPLMDDVARLRKQGLSIRAIAAALKRSKAGIEKALRRAKARGLLPLSGSDE